MFIYTAFFCQYNQDMQEMLVKTYRISIEFFGFMRKPKLIYFEFQQGTFRELLQLKNDVDNPEKLNEWLFNFLMEKTKQSDKLTLRLYEQLSTDERNSILEFLLKTFAKGFFEKSNDDGGKSSRKKSPDSSLIALLLDKTSETLESLLDMTWEQIDYLIEGIVWNINAGSKKGEETNARKMRMKMLKEEFSDEEETIKRLDAKMAERKNLKK